MKRLPEKAIALFLYKTIFPTKYLDEIKNNCNFAPDLVR